MITTLLRLWTDESGTAATETALFLAVIAVGTLGVFVGYAERLSDRVGDMARDLPSAEPTTGVMAEGAQG